MKSDDSEYLNWLNYLEDAQSQMDIYRDTGNGGE